MKQAIPSAKKRAARAPSPPPSPAVALALKPKLFVVDAAFPPETPPNQPAVGEGEMVTYPEEGGSLAVMLGDGERVEEDVEDGEELGLRDKEGEAVEESEIFPLFVGAEDFVGDKDAPREGERGLVAVCVGVSVGVGERVALSVAMEVTVLLGVIQFEITLHLGEGEKGGESEEREDLVEVGVTEGELELVKRGGDSVLGGVWVFVASVVKVNPRVDVEGELEGEREEVSVPWER